jgi:eukaryotic-like serine/threonine-protein kinase
MAVGLMAAGAPTPIDPQLVSEGLGAFDELEPLGSGTFGTTFKAVRGDDVYAIKVIHFPDMPEYLWRREVTSLRMVEHPNVVAFRDAGRFEVDGKEYPYLECEFIDGRSVRDNLDAGRRPGSADELRGLLTGLLSGGDWGSPVLLDFGLAKALDMSSHTHFGQLIGTKAYMAPEQLRGEPARKRSDLFAVALVVYEAGTGQHPFLTPETPTVQTLHDRMQADPPKDPRELVDDWPDDVAEVVLRLLLPEAHQRLGVSRALADLSSGSA